MSKPDALLVDVAALVESGHSNQMTLTVVAGGAVITGRLAPEAALRVNGPRGNAARVRPARVGRTLTVVPVAARTPSSVRRWQVRRASRKPAGVGWGHAWARLSGGGRGR
ncbi:hypothetical protein GCM10009680_44510 [Streptomyces yatensis]|uniref:BON domain-containing protein n=1 Tax=Streptomyces yatensis TaxID=155177 RepID=A0ABN2I6R3_9ACTN